MKPERIGFSDIETVSQFVFLRAGKLYHCRRAASTFLMGYAGEFNTDIIRAAEDTAARWNKRYSKKPTKKVVTINSHSYRREDLAWVLLTDKPPIGVAVLRSPYYRQLYLENLMVISEAEFSQIERTKTGQKRKQRDKEQNRYIARVRLKQSRNAEMRLADGTYPTWYDPTIEKENAKTNNDRKRK